MRNFIKLIMITIAVFAACHSFVFESGDTAIVVRNSSNYLISCYVADGLNSGFSYPDTLLPISLNSFCLKESIKDSAVVYSRRARNYEDLLQCTKEGVLSVFLFNQEDISRLGWEKVLTDNIILQRIDLTATDLTLLQGVISFPPSDKMMGIRMYPPYEEVIAKYSN